MPESYNPSEFIKKVLSLQPNSKSEVDVQDTYYLCSSNPKHIYRHRLDSEIQQLTLKGLTDDPETRLEVNLDLGLHKGSQSSRVKAFLRPLGIQWSGVIEKKVWAYYFPNCEVVYYEARYKDKSVRCIEIEAVNSKSIEAGKSVIHDFENQLGLDPEGRCHESLYHLLLSSDVKASLGT